MARIKKIMQADEDVGKVAQVVPVIISKALELFMASLIDEAARHTVQTGHKRVIPGHLKMAIKNNPMFDFLEGNVDAIADPIHVESKSTDERKVRRSRPKKTVEDGGQIPEFARDESNIEADTSSDMQQPQQKKQRIEPESREPSRSMSIANLLSMEPNQEVKSETAG